jgi:hypothetical protein
MNTTDSNNEKNRFASLYIIILICLIIIITLLITKLYLLYLLKNKKNGKKIAFDAATDTVSLVKTVDKSSNTKTNNIKNVTTQTKLKKKMIFFLIESLYQKGSL